MPGQSPAPAGRPRRLRRILASLGSASLLRVLWVCSLSTPSGSGFGTESGCCQARVEDHDDEPLDASERASAPDTTLGGPWARFARFARDRRAAAARMHTNKEAYSTGSAAAGERRRGIPAHRALYRRCRAAAVASSKFRRDRPIHNETPREGPLHGPGTNRSY